MADKTVYPTGYESLGRDVALKRALAEQMLKGTKRDRYGSWTQVLGDWAESAGGMKLSGEAARAEADLSNRIRGDRTAATQQLMEAIAGKPEVQAAQLDETGRPMALNTPMDYRRQAPADPVAAALPFADNPLLQDNKVLEALMAGYGERIKNGETYGDPTRMQGPGGEIITGSVNKAGNFRPMAGGMQVLPKMTDVNGVALDMDAQAPGTVLPQNGNELVVRDTPTNSQFLVNPLAFGAKTQLAQAGATRVNNNTYVDATMKNLGRYVPEAQIAGLTKGKEAAQLFIKAYPALLEAQRAVNKGMINGFGANVRLNLARAADYLGVTGKDQAERIANTQTYIRSMGQQLFPILQALRPASDTDVKTAERMTGGDITLSEAEIVRAVKAGMESGKLAVRQHRGEVGRLGKLYSGTPEASQGIQSFDVDTSEMDATEARQEALRASLAKRRKR